MTIPNPYWELLQAAKSTLTALYDLRIHTQGAARFLSSDIEAILIELESRAEYLRETIAAVEAAEK